MKTRNPKTDPAKAADDFNARTPIGTPVEVRLDNGTTRRTRTRSGAFVLGGHTAVVMLEGITGGYLLERVVALTQYASVGTEPPKLPRLLPPILACLALGLLGPLGCGGAPFTMAAPELGGDDGGVGGDPSPDAGGAADALASYEAGRPESIRPDVPHFVAVDAADGAEPSEAAAADAGPALCCQLKSDCHGALSHCNPINGDMCTCGPAYGGPLCTQGDIGGSCWIVGCLAGVLEACP